MNDTAPGLHHHVHGPVEYQLVTEAVRDTVMSGVLQGYDDYGVVIERRPDGTLFVYVLPVRPTPGLADGA